MAAAGVPTGGAKADKLCEAACMLWTGLTVLSVLYSAAGVWAIAFTISSPTYGSSSAFNVGFVVAGCIIFVSMGSVLVRLRGDARALLDAACGAASKTP